MSKPTYLYLLVNSDLTKFKIGVSKDVMGRALMLKHDFNLLVSYSVLWPSASSALNIEKVLHFYFYKNRVDMPYGDGYTEWFDYSVFSDALLLIKQFMIQHDLPDNALNKGVVLIDNIPRSKKPRLCFADKLALMPNCIEDYNRQIKRVYETIRSYEPFLLGIERDRILKDSSILVYYFGDLDENGLVLPDHMPIPIELEGLGTVILKTPFGSSGFNIFGSLSVSRDDSLVRLSITRGLSDIAKEEHQENLSMLVDLFDSYKYCSK